MRKIKTSWNCKLELDEKTESIKLVSNDGFDIYLKLKEHLAGKEVRISIAEETDKTNIHKNDIKNIFGDLIWLLRNAQKQFDSNYEAVGTKDLESQDILHKIELNNFNARDGFKLARKLQIVRQERRRLKDNNFILNHLLSFISKNKNLLQDLQKTVSSVIEAEKAQNERQYYPRSNIEL